MDVVSVARIVTAFARTVGFRDRVFTAAEVADCCRGGLAPDSPVAAARFAARFAAKEAARKALDVPGLSVEVRTGADGAPSLWRDGRPVPAAVSLSHDGGVAVAVVVSGR